MIRLILIFALVFLTSCAKTSEDANNLNQEMKIEEKNPDFEQIAEIFMKNFWARLL